MKRFALFAFAAVLAAGASAKLPPLSDDAKAKAAEAAARTAHGNKTADYQLCKSLDRVALKYIADAKRAGKEITPTATPPCVDPGPFVAATPAAAAVTAAASAPVAKPIEAAGAHSPTATAATPPSTKTPAAASPAK